MADNYNIDDILSEVKKRREENEQQIKSGEPTVSPEPQEATKLNMDKPEPVVEAMEPEEPSAPEEAELTVSDEPAPAEEEGEEPQLNLVGEDFENPPEEPEDVELFLEETDISQTGDMPQEVMEAAADTQEEGMVDLLQITERADELEAVQDRDDDMDKKAQKGHKVRRGIIITLLVIILGFAIFGLIYINNALNTVSGGNGTSTEETWKGMDTLEESFVSFNEVEATELSSLQDMIKTWYYTGTTVKSTHVLNVLLIGEDTRGDEILEKGTRADSAIIASVNADTGEINLTSILRDAYTYYEVTPGDETTGKFGKINEAMSYGGVDAYINCVEHMYKIDIDNYVIVNFDSFQAIVDKLGGVTLEITSKEINEINNHQKRYNHTTIEKTFEGDKGKMKLTGKQALAYCRIRKLDSDNMRANRQKICLTQIFKEAKSASPTKLVSIVNTLIPYVRTGYNKQSIVKIAKYALSNGWMSYKIVTNNIPNSRINERGSGGIFFGTWCWKSDFPQDAYDLQMRTYGKSNITLAQQRVDVLKCQLKGFRKDGAALVYPTVTNNAYGQVSTTQATTEE